MSGLGAVVARTPGGREVASSILVAPTIVEINVILMYLVLVKRAIFFCYTPRFGIFLLQRRTFVSSKEIIKPTIPITRVALSKLVLGNCKQ